MPRAEKVRSKPLRLLARLRRQPDRARATKTGVSGLGWSRPWLDEQPDAASRDGHRVLSFQAENSKDSFRISGAYIFKIYSKWSAFLAMLQKVLPRCVMTGPGEPKSAPRRARPSPGPSRLARRARQSTIPRRLARLPHPGRIIWCQMRMITLRDAKTTKVAF